MVTGRTSSAGGIRDFGLTRSRFSRKLDRFAPAGERFSKGIGVGLLILAIVVVWVPDVAPGLTSRAAMGT